MLWAGAEREASGGEAFELDKGKGEDIPGKGNGRRKRRKRDFSGPLRDALWESGDRDSGITLFTSGNGEALLYVNL